MHYRANGYLVARAYLPRQEISNGAVDIDNFGNRYTGGARVGTSLAWNNPVGLGDQLSVRVQTGGSGFSYGRVGYQLPVGPWATRIGVAWAQMEYELGKDFASLDADGEARVGSLYLMHPLLRSRQSSWFVTLQYDDKQLRDRVGVTLTESDKQLHTWNLGLSGHFRDGLGGGGLNSVSLNHTSGDLNLDELSAWIDDLSAQAMRSGLSVCVPKPLGRRGMTSRSRMRTARHASGRSWYTSSEGSASDQALTTV